MKVIHLIGGGDTGGAKTHVHSLLTYLGQVVDVRLVCFRKGIFADEAKALGIPTDVMQHNVLWCVCALQKLIREEGYQFVHCH
ncbi:MAG: polysaccharide pyruvyl transferase CsaB, partial [Oscillospiraceae bacterium]|nr:polysaccharide pyruvyl transferase CsaB [Oscillospiraceae bacterium]